MDCDCLVDCQGSQSQKEGQEDQGEVKELGGYPFLGPLSPSPGRPAFLLALGSLAIHQAIQRLSKGLSPFLSAQMAAGTER